MVYVEKDYFFHQKVVSQVSLSETDLFRPRIITNKFTFSQQVTFILKSHQVSGFTLASLDKRSLGSPQKDTQNPRPLAS